ncbi:MAG: hypothetical protein CM1200mP38_2870 [Dehalococcoidia bacterium]|nr:MAG: hypothetical protein CM1200mP38_2870 [Dehalococcoidia bacterium]
MLEGKNYSRGMVIVAHADDAEFGCSGTVRNIEAWLGLCLCSLY